MNVKKMIDRGLMALGLVRASKYEAMNFAWSEYACALASAAKAKGVTVAAGGERLDGLEIDSDAFIIGDFNAVTNCQFRFGARLYLPPSCNGNVVTDCSFIANSQKFTILPSWQGQ